MKKISLLSILLIATISKTADTSELISDETALKLNFGSIEHQEAQSDIQIFSVVQTNFGKNPKNAFVGMYSGSTKGSRVAAGKTSIKSFPELILSLKEKSGQTRANVKIAHNIIDTDLKQYYSRGQRSTAPLTALTALIEERDDEPVLYLASVGNLRAILTDQGGGIADETKDHSIESNPESKPYLRTPSGKFITRALGVIDREVSPIPEIKKIKLTPEHKTLILASDGFWNKISSKQAAEYVAHELRLKTPNDIAQELQKKALKLNSTDNISIIVIQFKWKIPSQTEETSPVVLNVPPQLKDELSKIIKNLFKKIPSNRQKFYNEDFEEILSLLSNEAPDYQAIEKIIGHLYISNITKEEGPALSLACDIFYNVISGNFDKANKIIATY